MVILKTSCEGKKREKHTYRLYFMKKSGSYHDLIMKEENLTL